MGERGQGAALQDQLWVSLHGLDWRQTGREQRGQEQTLKWLSARADTNRAPQTRTPRRGRRQEARMHTGARGGPFPPTLPASAGPAASHNGPRLQRLKLAEGPKVLPRWVGGPRQQGRGCGPGCCWEPLGRLWQAQVPLAPQGPGSMATSAPPQVFTWNRCPLGTGVWGCFPLGRTTVCWGRYHSSYRSPHPPVLGSLTQQCGAAVPQRVALVSGDAEGWQGVEAPLQQRF